MKAKINKSGVLEINTECELEEFAMCRLIAEFAIEEDVIVVNNDYDKIKVAKNSYDEQQKMIEDLLKNIDLLNRENSRLKEEIARESISPKIYQ